jgi:hypothetical protein
MPEDTITSEVPVKDNEPAPVPFNDVTKKVNSVLDKSDDFRKNVNSVDGFAIQVYTGTNSEEARKIRGKVISLLPDTPVRLFYDEPNFKVKAGRFFNRIEAQEYFSIVKEEFPTAIIIPDKIPISENESEE